jgi:hypothetical protein
VSPWHAPEAARAQGWVHVHGMQGTNVVHMQTAGPTWQAALCSQDDARSPIRSFVKVPLWCPTPAPVDAQAAEKKQEAGYWKTWWGRFQAMSYGQKNAVYRKVREDAKI